MNAQQASNINRKEGPHHRTKAPATARDADLRAMAKAFRESADTLDLRFSLGADDHVAFARWANWDSPKRRFYRWAAMGLPMVVFLVAVLARPGALSGADGEGLLNPGNGIFLLVSIAASALTPLWMRHRLGQRVKRHLSANPHAGLVGDFHIELHPEGLILEGPNGRSEFQRGQFFRPEEGAEHWFLFVQEKAAFLLPKAPFAEEEREDIRLALAHLAGASEER